jgi:hypothetical protein
MAQTAEVCPLCGGPRTDWGCRRVPAGDWCLSRGLKGAPGRFLPQAADPMVALVERDPNVQAAAAVLDKATRAAAAATSEWESAALANLQVRNRRMAGTQTIFAYGGEPRTIMPAGTSDRDLRRLADAEAEADAARRKAAERAIAARQELEAARARARRELSRTPAAG